MFDERTDNYSLPLPQKTNPLHIDVDRLRGAITQIDALLKVVAHMAAAAVSYIGQWDAADNKPKIPSASLDNKGHYYIVSVGGSTKVDGVETWHKGDWIISTGTAWTRVINRETFDAAAIQSGKFDLDRLPEVPVSSVVGLSMTLDGKADRVATEAAFANNEQAHEHLYEVKADVGWATNEFNNRYTKADANASFVKTGRAVGLNPQVASEYFDLLNHDGKGDFWRICLWDRRVRIRDSGGRDLITFGADGNVFGSVWEGGALSTHLENRCQAHQDAARNWAYGNLLQDSRLTGWWEIELSKNGWTHCPNGGVVTALHTVSDGRNVIRYESHFGGRYLQMQRGGNWFTIGVW